MRVEHVLDGPGAGQAGAPVAAALLGWYDRNARILPWRAPLGANRADPYRVWLSEIMLQQTTVAAVTGYFERFTARWPTVEALAAADDGEVMATWAGLGYYARARNMLAAARIVAGEMGGRFPAEEAALRALPGVGAYTAAAIAAIAHGRRAVAVDANVERVVARLFAIAEPLPGGRAAIRAAAETIVPELRAGDFTQGLMDLGATVCTSRAPRCDACPLTAGCLARLSGDPARFPVKAAKRARPVRFGAAWWIERAGAVWLVRRPANGLLGGMRALPTSEWGYARMVDPPFAARWDWLDTSVTHVFTHFSLDLRIARALVASEPPGTLGVEGGWWPLATLGEAGLPTVFARAASAAMRGKVEKA